MNLKHTRKHTIKTMIGNLQIGNQNHVVIQSMCTIKTSKTLEVLEQINKLFLLGCEMIRVSILDDSDIESLKRIVKESPIPVVADIHFDPNFAIKSILAGAKKIRLNPGNISNEEELHKICDLANQYDVAIRIGVNSGSLPLDLVDKYGVSEKSMILALKRYIDLFNKFKFNKIIISLKSEDPLLMMKVYQKASKIYKYPLHLGVTEAGQGVDGVIKSCVGLTPLLLSGIGDTIRISLTDDPQEEIYACKRLLNTLGLRKDMVDIISCPTCGRLEYNMKTVVQEIKEYTKTLDIPLKISILGCVVNGIGEGKMADIGLAGSKDKCILFKQGKIYKQIDSEFAIEELKALIDEYKKQYR